MDQVPLVESQIDDGRLLVERLAREGFPVTAAFWLMTSEDGQWFLYLVSPAVDSEGHTGTYRRIYPVMRQMTPSLGIHPLEVKVVSPSSSEAEAVREINRQHPWKGGFHYGYGCGQLPGTSIEGAYIYPPPTTVPSGQADG